MLGDDDDYSPEAILRNYENNVAPTDSSNSICTESAKSFETFSKNKEEK